jgi:hypothetical protein
MSLRFTPVVVTDAATYSVKDYNSGLLHVLPNFTATCTISLPSPKKGLSYEFWYGGAAADAQNAVITTGSDTYYFIGGVVFMDQDTDVMAPVYADGNSNSKLTLVTPEVGTRVSVICNGTQWYLNGNVFSATTPTLGDQ